MSIGLPEKAEQRTEQVLVRLTKMQKRKLAMIAAETGLTQAVLGHHAIIALVDGYDNDAPTPSKKKRKQK